MVAASNVVLLCSLGGIAAAAAANSSSFRPFPIRDGVSFFMPTFLIPD
jgi:hypothetical protein